MARPPRIDVPNGLYHVTSRGNGRARIFFSDGDRLRFLDRLRDHLDAAEVELLALTRYIHLNPVKVAACRRLGKAARRRMLTRFRWSSYPGYAAGKSEWEFVSYEVLKHYGRNATEARRHYRAYVEACLLEEDGPLVAAMAASRHVIGDQRFVEREERRLAGLRRGRPQDQDLDLPRPAVPLEQIDAAVAARFGVPAGVLRTKGRHVGPARWVVMELACRLGGLTQRAVGQHYGQVTCAAVSLTRRKLRNAPRKVAQILKELLAELSAQSRPTRRGRRQKLKT